MSNHRESELENILAGFVSKLRDIPFEIAIKGLYDRQVLKFDTSQGGLIQVLNQIAKSMVLACQMIQQTPIDYNKRANEVGNAMEAPTMKALNQHNLQAETPITTKGKKASGYPDIVILHEGLTIYLEVKTYSKEQLGSRLRSFCMSPSNTPKITADAYHLLVGFEILKTDLGYLAQSFKLIDMHGVKTDFKAEINTSNSVLYRTDKLLATGDIKQYKTITIPD